MRPFERYAAIALLFLVTLVVVFVLWDDDGSKVEAANGDAMREVARIEDSVTPRHDLRGGSTDASGGVHRDGAGGGLAVNGLDVPDNTYDKVTTRGVAGSDHSVTPGAYRTLEDPRAGDRIDPKAGELPELEFAERERGPLRPERIYPGEDSSERASSGFLARGGDRSRGGSAEAGDGSPASASSTNTRTETIATPPDGRTTSTTSPSGEYRTYIVKAGDALSRIASRECGSLSAQDLIVSLNGLSDPDTIREGMKLKLPKEFAPSATGESTVRIASSDVSRPSNSEGRPTVTVKKDEVLGLILERELGTYSGSIGLVRKLNPGLDPDRIVFGQTIILPRADELPGTPARRTAPRGSASPEAPRLAANRTNRPTTQANEFVVR